MQMIKIIKVSFDPEGNVEAMIIQIETMVLVQHAKNWTIKNE